MSESWKALDGFDYEISSNGRVRHFKNGLKKLSVHRNGYSSVSLWKNGKEKRELIHRLVAKKFLGNIDGMEINHKDFNKLNNRVENLEIVTKKQNTIHAKHGKRFTGNRNVSGSKNPASKIDEEQVRKIRAMKDSGARYKEIIEQFGIKKSQLWNIISGKSWKNA
jgi:hypothetical protein